ncbi:hypothetical protein niasHS_009969 [Heterodera schachtii]|uniref:Uncharacterized protein n=1 Tax=Heterodera schachtii TaxID=97005 RepID=A0ABD2JD18_HETSC
MSFAIPFFCAVLIACAICVKNDNKKTTTENENNDGDGEGSNSVGIMPKAFRVLTSILAVQSCVGLVNASSKLPAKSEATHFLRNGPPTEQFAREYTPPAAEVGNHPLNTKTSPVQNDMPTSPSSVDNAVEDEFLEKDYADPKTSPPIHNKVHQ